MQLLIYAAQIVARIEVPGIDLQRLDETFERFRGTPGVAQDVAEIEPHENVSRKTAREPLQQRLGFAEPAFHGEGVCDTELELRCARIEAARLAECFPGIRVARKREVRLRQVAEHAGMIAARARCALEVVDRRFGLPELQQRRPSRLSASGWSGATASACWYASFAESRFPRACSRKPASIRVCRKRSSDCIARL
jgi:hypothetical protein